MSSLTLKKSKAKNKKYALVVEQKDGRTKTVNFGYSPMEDFTQHHDK
jgi:phage FluMu protein Com